MKGIRPALLLLFVLSWTTAGGREPVRVATINISNYLVADRLVEGVYRREYPKPEEQKAALRAMLRAVNADVVALQEIGTEPFLRELQRDLCRDGLEYAHRAWLKGADPDRHLAVLSRLPFREVLRHDRLEFNYFDESIPVKRGLLEIAFGAPDGSVWRLFNLHLKSRYTTRPDDPQSEERRVREARVVRDLLRERLETDPEARLLVAGDLNDTRASRTLARFLEVNKRPLFTMVPSADSRGETWTHCYRREDVYSRVDYFLTSPAMESAVVGGKATIIDQPEFADASDHRLLWLDLKFTAR